ncbi:lipid droplet-associated protein [Actinokineospora enzanensis]|uniref:lipid droplet-associated protein n=1 Tax=Actinokineospora enzanensis TaxID=155975 RepID=UPI00036D4D39|nr:lipid droplet-associated protein [Actinokineospora enzanensis]
MKSLPLPLRVAAGLAVTAVERARDLPTRIAGLPVTVASQALQVSMRVQQHVTELAVKGDEALASLRPAEENPEWATFDEDLDDEAPAEDHRPAFDRVEDDEPEQAEELWDERRGAPASVASYDELSMAQLRARLRALSVDSLEELLDYERAHQNRPSFVSMLTRRIATVRDNA